MHHIFDLRLRFSLRPAVVKNGPYTDASMPGGKLAYFASDRFVNSDIDVDVPEEDRMKEHRRVTLSTTHAWKLFSRGWNRAKDAATGEAPSLPEDPGERARRELMAELERPAQELLDSDLTSLRGSSERLYGGYRASDVYYAEPLRFRAEVTYDALDAEQREEQKRRHHQLDQEAQVDADNSAKILLRKEKLAEPWKDPLAELRFLYANWTFNANVRYSIYARTAREMNFNLGLPSIMATKLGLGYSVSKAIDLELGTFTRTREQRMTIATSLIPAVTSYLRLRSRVTDGATMTHANGVGTAVGFDYQSPAKCWGLQFVREKDYDRDEAEASYVMRLMVVFMGQSRPLPNMASGLNRETNQEPR